MRRFANSSPEVGFPWNCSPPSAVVILAVSRLTSVSFVLGPVSVAPSGLVRCRIATHGLRRGLHSCAASRLTYFASRPACAASRLAYFGSQLCLFRFVEISAVRIEGNVHSDIGFGIGRGVFPFLDRFHCTFGQDGIAADNQNSIN